MPTLTKAYLGSTQRRVYLGTSLIADSAPASADPVLLSITGQSNAAVAGTSTATPGPEYDNLTDAWIWDSVAGAFVAYQMKANSGSGGQQENGWWGSEAEFIRNLNADQPGRKVYIVKEHAHGNALASTGAGDWAPSSTGERYDSYKAQMNAARAALSGLGVSTFEEVQLWCQGEADTNTTNEPACDNYEANLNALLAQMATDGLFSASGKFIIERIRPISADLTIKPYNNQYKVRAAQEAVAAADARVDIVGLDFEPGDFAEIHPGPTWAKGKGERSYAAWKGTYAATYGAITDHDPSNLTFADQTGAVAGETATSAVLAIEGIESGAPVSISGAGEYQITNPDGTVWKAWGTTAGTIHPFQRIQLRATASGTAGATVSTTVTVGGVSDTWTVQTAAGAASYEPETDAFISTLSAQGGGTMTASQKSALDAVFVKLKADGLMTKLDRLYIHSMHDNVAGRINLIDQTTMATSTGSANDPVPWTQAGGYNPANVSNRKVDYQIAPTSLPQDSITIGAWFASITDDTDYDLASADLSVALRATSSAIRARLHSGNSNLTGITPTPGFIAASRTAANLITFYGAAGTSLGTTTTASSAPSGVEFVLGASNGLTADRGIRAGFIGQGLTDADAQNLRDALNTFFGAF